MTNDEKKKYLNSFFNNVKAFQYGGPKSLFKYRPFDAFAFDMLENKYLYLCPTENEDDETECDISFDMNDYYDIHHNKLKLKAIDLIFKQVESHTSQENMAKAKEIISDAITKEGVVSPPILLQRAMDCQYFGLIPPEDCTNLVNWLVNIPERLDDPEIKSQIEKLFVIGYNAKRDTGICSLCESGDDVEMWKMYAGNGTGYCVEYDVSDYEYNASIFPVIYEDRRETNIVMQILDNFIGQLITGFSHGEIDADKTQFMRLFLTKNTKWEQQKEWRLVGVARGKMPAPTIKRIYLGKNVVDENKQKMIQYADKNKIEVVILKG